MKGDCSIAKTVKSDSSMYGEKGERMNIGVVTPILMKSGVVPTLNLLNILGSLAHNLYAIEIEGDSILPDFPKRNNRIHIYKGINHKPGANAFTRIRNYFYTEVRVSYKLWRVSKRVDFWVFYGTRSPLPLLTAKMMRKKVVLASAASSVQILKAMNDIFFNIERFLSMVNHFVSDEIIVYSPSHIKEWHLEKYRSKISIAHEHFLDFDKFEIKKQLDERDNLVGYVGRLNKGKGVLNFVKAIPEISEERDEIKFLVGGEGQLRDEIEGYLDKESLIGKVRLLGWIPHDELPKYLNELKLLILPSYTEGLPNIILEAMACGTPVLATPVGAITDIIKDNETGFIMENNSPECIAGNIIRALNYANLQEIVQNAHNLVKREFTYEKAVEKYKRILSTLC